MTTAVSKSVVTITVYSRPACVQCNATYRALDTFAKDEYTVVDVSEDVDARKFVMSLGCLQAPVVVLTDQNGNPVVLEDKKGDRASHWSGYKPNWILALKELLVA